MGMNKAKIIFQEKMLGLNYQQPSLKDNKHGSSLEGVAMPTAK